MHGPPITTPPSYATRSHRTPGNDAGNTTPLQINDLSLAPKSTIQLRPSFARDASDIGGYRFRTSTEPERESSRIEIPISALTIHASTPQMKPSFSAPPFRAISLKWTDIGWGDSLL